MSDTSARVVIVGAGHAGGSVAALLRQYGWQGPITLIGAEPVPPYQRPPLSKAWLKGEGDLAGLLLRPAAFYQANRIDLRLACEVTAIDRAARAVTLGTGDRVPYDHLILATGCCARSLPVPGHDLAGIVALRTLADADRLRTLPRPGARIAIIGAGYIGLEVAASARILGAEVVVIEREPRVLARVASIPLSDFFQRRHAAEGVRIVLNAAVEAFEGAHGHVAAVRLSDGTAVPCDAVLIGVGAAPNDALARAAGLACDNGIVVDLAARTADPAIHAIGDCTRRPLPLYHRTGRLESVPNALEQAKQAAADLCGRPAPAARGAVVLVRSVRRPAADRRPSLRCDGDRRARRPAVRIVRDLPSERERHRSGGRGSQRAGRVHGGTHDDRPAKAGGSGEAARRVMLDA